MREWNKKAVAEKVKISKTLTDKDSPFRYQRKIPRKHTHKRKGNKGNERTLWFDESDF